MPQQKFLAIYKTLKSRIEAGAYPVGQLLPSENALLAEFGCSRNTVRRAIAGLVRDGYVQTRQGRGVSNIFQPIEPSSYKMGTIESFAETARRTHQQASTRVVRFELCTADAALARRTGFEPGAELYYIQRVHCINGAAQIFNHNFFRASCTSGLTPEIAAGSIYRYLENTLGMSIVTSKRTITVEKATALDRAWIDLGEYDCLAVMTSQTYNSEGILFEHTESRHHPAIFRFQDNAVRPARRPDQDSGA